MQAQVLYWHKQQVCMLVQQSTLLQNAHDIDGHLDCYTCKAARYMMTWRDSVHLARPLRQAGWKQSPQWDCIMSCSHNMRSTNSSALAMSPPLLAAATTCST